MMEALAAAYLIICSISDQGAIRCVSYVEPDMQTCRNILLATIVQPNHAGGDMQTQSVVSCAAEENNFYSPYSKNQK